MATILEKEKGSFLEKLRSIILMEGDLQTMMQEHLKSNSKELIEKDSRFSKAQHKSRKHFQFKQYF